MPAGICIQFAGVRVAEASSRLGITVCRLTGISDFDPAVKCVHVLLFYCYIVTLGGEKRWPVFCALLTGHKV